MKPYSHYSAKTGWQDEHSLVTTIRDILRTNPSGYVPGVLPNQRTGEEDYNIALYVLNVLYHEGNDTVFIGNNQKGVNEDGSKLAVGQANMILRTSGLVRLECMELIMCGNSSKDQLFIQNATENIIK